MRVLAFFPLFLILLPGLQAHADWRGGKVVSLVWNSNPELQNEFGPLTRVEITLEDTQFDKATYHHFISSAHIPVLSGEFIYQTAKEAMLHDQWFWMDVHPEKGIVAVALTPAGVTSVRDPAHPAQGRGSSGRKASSIRVAGAGADGDLRDLLGRSMRSQPGPSAR